MPELSTLLVFSAAALLLLVTPGPAVLYIVTRSIDQGRLAGVVSVLGIGIGTMVHVFAAALGISALLVSSAAAFNVVKYLGAAYLIYLGVRKFMERDQPVDAIQPEAQPLSRAFTQGIVVNLLNPKLALFFLRFCPTSLNLPEDRRRGRRCCWARFLSFWASLATASMRSSPGQPDPG